MTERTTSSQGRLRSPTLGEWIGLIVAVALVWLIGAVVAGYTDWSPLPWVVGAAMVLVLIRWLLKLRAPSDVQWGGAGGPGAQPPYNSYDGMSSSGGAP